MNEYMTNEKLYEAFISLGNQISVARADIANLKYSVKQLEEEIKKLKEDHAKRIV